MEQKHLIVQFHLLKITIIMHFIEMQVLKVMSANNNKNKNLSLENLAWFKMNNLLPLTHVHCKINYYCKENCI